MWKLKAIAAGKAKVDEAQKTLKAKKAYEAEKAKVEAQNVYPMKQRYTKAESEIARPIWGWTLKSHGANQKGNQSNAWRLVVENAKAQKDCEAELARVLSVITKQYEAEKHGIEKGKMRRSVTSATADASQNWGWLSSSPSAYDQKVKDAQTVHKLIMKQRKQRLPKMPNWRDYAAKRWWVVAQNPSNKAKQDVYGSTSLTTKLVDTVDQ